MSKWKIFGKYKWTAAVVDLAETYERVQHPHKSLLDCLHTFYGAYRHTV